MKRIVLPSLVLQWCSCESAKLTYLSSRHCFHNVIIVLQKKTRSPGSGDFVDPGDRASNRIEATDFEEADGREYFVRVSIKRSSLVSDQLSKTVSTN